MDTSCEPLNLNTVYSLLKFVRHIAASCLRESITLFVDERELNGEQAPSDHFDSHAGVEETSRALYAFPHLVKLEALRSDRFNHYTSLYAYSYRTRRSAQARPRTRTSSTRRWSAGMYRRGPVQFTADIVEGRPA